MSENQKEISYAEYLELKFQLTYDLKTLTDNVSRLTEYTEKNFETQKEEMEAIKNCLQEAKAAKTPEVKKSEGNSSLPSNIKWLLILIMGIAFLGALGAAIGINLLQYLPSTPPNV